MIKKIERPGRKTGKIKLCFTCGKQFYINKAKVKLKKMMDHGDKL